MTTIRPGRYRHYKGKEYTVLGVARHSETREELVVYRQEYGDQGLWVRPKQMFLETVKVEGQDLAAWDALFAAALERFGEREMAAQCGRVPHLGATSYAVEMTFPRVSPIDLFGPLPTSAQAEMHPPPCRCIH